MAGKHTIVSEIGFDKVTDWYEARGIVGATLAFVKIVQDVKESWDKGEAEGSSFEEAIGMSFLLTLSKLMNENKSFEKMRELAKKA